MQEKIIDLLKRKSGHVSGEDISRHLKISRQALWKHIQDLRESGYEILAVPHLGYHLVSSPDRLFPSEITRQLCTLFIGKKIYYFDNIASTMDAAAELALKGAPEGTLILAEAQNRGRGRLGRSWSSPKYKGIYLSLVLRPKILPSEAAILTLLSAVSVCEAIRDFCGLDARIKWPNDILINQKKAGGILTELNAEMDEIRFVVIGIGLNVNNDQKSLPDAATSLREQKNQIFNRVELLQGILRELEANYLALKERGNGFIAEKWRGYALTLGKRIKVIQHRQHLEGEAVDIDDDGSLLVRKDSGVMARVTSGDIVHHR